MRHAAGAKHLVPLALLLGFLFAAPVHAEAITVNTTADQFGDGAPCSVREAAHAAFTNAPFGGCPAGGAGTDAIRLKGGQTYRLTRARSGSDTEGTGDIDVFASVSIRAPGNGLATIDAGKADDRAFQFSNGGSEIHRVRVRGGDSPEGGGGVFVSDTLFVEDSVIAGNRASGGGGGITSFANLILETSAVSGNRAGFNGGGIFNAGGLLVVMDSTVSGNRITTPGHGGAGILLDAGTGSALLQNTTLSGNLATATGGGLSANDGSVTIDDSTVTANRASGWGAGLNIAGGASVTSRNSIIAGNELSSGSAPDCFGSLSGFYNLIGDTAGCGYFPSFGDLLGEAPRLAPLADNGGAVRTHALLDDSPAIDAGKASGSGQCLPADARLVPRSLGGPCDLGAYERVECAGTVVNRVGTGNRDVLSGTGSADGFLLFGGNDLATGRGGRDCIQGGDGRDKLLGQGGRDRLFGEGGKDRLFGGAKADRLVGGPARDLCDGGPGKDKLSSC